MKILKKEYKYESKDYLKLTNFRIHMNIHNVGIKSMPRNASIADRPRWMLTGGDYWLTWLF